ncbi:hypothetical protein CDS [Bradyrhizobium sp.]|uniref:hypothetical protein n=1 Tax=Bradyrhizobium sp. TaxID=376 RepID=UPI0007C1E182|nr:hypothetical protein [Bradyrhizobium sp.]CUU18779.1 hypothetical protein CDS [Bradyrhizobium sp.]
MAKAKVTFKTVRLSDSDWKILADYPDHEQREITGFASKADADFLMLQPRRVMSSRVITVTVHLIS